MPAESSQSYLRPWSTEWLQVQEQTLGASACRQLGFYAIPDEFVLSDTARAQVEQGLDLHDDTDDPTANFAAMVGLE